MHKQTKNAEKVNTLSFNNFPVLRKQNYFNDSVLGEFKHHSGNSHYNQQLKRQPVKILKLIIFFDLSPHFLQNKLFVRPQRETITPILLIKIPTGRSLTYLRLIYVIHLRVFLRLDNLFSVYDTRQTAAYVTSQFKKSNSSQRDT